MAAPRVSVTLPCWNAAPYLPRALQSLAAQTFSDFEVIAVDDGSTDQTPQILREWASRDARIRLVEQNHAGVVTAANAAVDRARADLIARFDADDIMHPRRLEWQTDLFEAAPNLTIAGGLVRCFPRAKLGDGMKRYEQWLNSLRAHEEIVRDIFVENVLVHPSIMVRAEAMRRVGAYRDEGWPEDYDLLLRLYGAGAQFAKVPRVVLWWRDQQQRLTRTRPEYAFTQFRRCKVHYLRALHLKERNRVAIWGAGKEGRALGKHVKRVGLEITRFIDIAPTKLGKRLLGAPVETSDALQRDEYLLVAVGAAGARDLIREELAARGWSEPDDYRTMA